MGRKIGLHEVTGAALLVALMAWPAVAADQVKTHFYREVQRPGKVVQKSVEREVTVPQAVAITTQELTPLTVQTTTLTAPAPVMLSPGLEMRLDQMPALATGNGSEPVEVTVYSPNFSCINCERIKQTWGPGNQRVRVRYTNVQPSWQVASWPHVVWTRRDGVRMSASTTDLDELERRIEVYEPGRIRNVVSAVPIGRIKGGRPAAIRTIEKTRQVLGRDGRVSYTWQRGQDAEGVIPLAGNIGLQLPQTLSCDYGLEGEDRLTVRFGRPYPAIRIGEIIPMSQDVRGVALTASELSLDLPWMIDPSIKLE